MNDMCRAQRHKAVMQSRWNTRKAATLEAQLGEIEQMQKDGKITILELNVSSNSEGISEIDGEVVLSPHSQVPSGDWPVRFVTYNAGRKVILNP